MAFALGVKLQVIYTALPMIQPGVQTGRVKILAITRDKRVSSEPDVPERQTAQIAEIADLLGMKPLYKPD